MTTIAPATRWTGVLPFLVAHSSERNSALTFAKLCFACVITALLFLGVGQGIVHAAEGDFIAVPKLEKRVTDLTATLSAADEAQIEAAIKAFEQKKGAQIAVLIVPSTLPEDAFTYGMRVQDQWKLGRKGVDDGVLFLIAKNDRKMQILTGPGISGALTDAMSRRIIAEVVAPRFREGNFAAGVANGVDKMIGVIDGEALPPPPTKKRASSSTNFEGFFFLAIFAAIFVGPMLRALLGRFLGASATGGVTGLAAWWLAGGLIFPIAVGAIVFIIALVMGFANFSNWRGGGGGGGWSTGGWSSGGGGGSSDSFSGGGGSFDGGGASGDW